MDQSTLTAASPPEVAQAARDTSHRALLILVHLGAFAALFVMPTLRSIALVLVLMFLTGGVGLSLGYHRLLAHRAFDCPTWLLRTLATLGAAGLQGGPLSWVGIHRRHHQTADIVGKDPHNPKDGVMHAYIGWIYNGWGETKEKHRHHARDLARDPYLRWLDHDTPSALPWLVVAVACFGLGGWNGLLWGAFFRTVLVWHLSWCVGSIVHVWGTRRYDLPDDSGNIFWLGYLGFGEGWHNNHHAYPGSVFFGHKWWEFDIPAYVALLLEKTGLAWNVWRPPPLRKGSGVGD